MFLCILAFNQLVGKWNIKNVTNMKNMFSGAEEFNKPIGNWYITKVTNMVL